MQLVAKTYPDLLETLGIGLWALARRTHFKRSEMFGEREVNIWGEEGDGYGAGVDNLGPARYISAYRPLPMHTDPDSKKWSHFILLRTKHTTVWAKDGQLPFMQVPGAYMRVNVHEPHSLVRAYPYALLWGAAVIDTDEPLEEADAIAQFRAMARGLREYAAGKAKKAA